LCRGRERLRIAFGPEKCESERDQRVEPFLPVQLGNELTQLLGGTRVIRELDQCNAPLQTDLAPQVVVVGELERLGVQVDHGVLGPASTRRVGRGEEIRNRTRRLACLAPVIREDRRQRLGRTCDRLLDVTRDGGVSLAPRRPRHGCIGDLTNEHVLERELDVTGKLTRRIAPHEIARLEQTERIVHVGVDSSKRLQDAAPERLSNDSRREKKAACIRGHGVDARGNRLPDRYRQLVAISELDHRGRKLLEEEWIASGDFDEPREIETGLAR